MRRMVNVGCYVPAAFNRPRNFLINVIRVSHVIIKINGRHRFTNQHDDVANRSDDRNLFTFDCYFCWDRHAKIRGGKSLFIFVHIHVRCFAVPTRIKSDFGKIRSLERSKMNRTQYAFARDRLLNVHRHTCIINLITLSDVSKFHPDVPEWTTFDRLNALFARIYINNLKICRLK